MLFRSPLETVTHLSAEDQHRYDELLEDILARLQPSDRPLLKERLQGFSYAEIAKRYRLKEDTVRQRLHRIIKRLRKEYNP